MSTKAEAYVTTHKSKGFGNESWWYQITFEEQFSKLSYRWEGPYRDKTDAENAAHDEAKRRNLELIWRD